jgi:outer membrane receptor protein involved in Fe transport
LRHAFAVLACALTTLVGHRSTFAATPDEAAATVPGGAESSGPPPAPGNETRLPDVVVESEGARGTLRDKMRQMDRDRDEFLLPKLGASTYRMDADAIDALPQGKNTPLDKVLLQAPGVSYDSAVSNPDFHVRNEYANVQYRINGIQLPDGVSGLGPVLETGFIGSLDLLDGALPAQYGLRTAGVVDITTRSRFTPAGSAELDAGSLGTLSPSVEYGGSCGDTQYFVSGRYLKSDLGLENALPTTDPIHDHTTQGKFFTYASTLVGDSSRLSFIGGASIGHFQIPDVTGEPALGNFGPPGLDSASLDENETDRFFFGILALQTQAADYSTQFSIYSRYTTVHFVPDVPGDLAFNNVASDVVRQSLLDGIQFDASYRASAAHTLRAGLGISAELTQVDDVSTVLPLGPGGAVLPVPQTINDAHAKLGWNAGAYVQDAWALLSNLVLNTGVRFDQMNQFVNTSQVSPRLALVYTPSEGSTLHAGYARYFTPPMQAQATPNNLALFQGTTQQPTVALDSPVVPERSSYIDVGIDQRLGQGLTAGADVYYKRATDLLDDGQFGQAVVLTQFNYAHGYSEGVELKAKYRDDGLVAYANLSANRTRAKDVVSNQYLFTDPVEFAYLAKHYIYTDDDQSYSASAGASYRWETTLASIDALYGSGLRTDFANLDHVPAYVQVNAAVAHDFQARIARKPLTVRLSVINLLDRSYLLRSGSGIGEFAPQYGPRRGFFIGIAQAF